MNKRNVKIQEDTTDRISELPECIIENILLRLDHPKERVRVSVLSKRFFALTASLPVLEFNSSAFWNHRICCSDVSDKFYKYVEHTVSRFCSQQNVMNAHTFKLCTTSATDEELKIIDACLELIILKGVKVLEISINEYWYHLPDILTSASSLTYLKVFYCMLPSSLMVDAPNFKSLKVLCLNDVHLDPLVIKHLTASCPLLEELIVEYCYCYKKLYLYGKFQNLKKANFIYNLADTYERIDIEAPNLCEFICLSYYVKGRGASSVNLGLCKQLRTLCLGGTFFSTSTGLSDFLSNFPILENLYMCLVNRCNSLTISSPSLRKFVLFDKCDPEEIDITTPNLLLFIYANSSIFYNLDEFINNGSGESHARMEFRIINDVDTLWFQQLKRFLVKSDRFKVLSLHNNIGGKIFVDFEQLKVIQSPPYQLEHVTLAYWKTNELSVMDGILWCCRPQSLSLTSGFSSISDKKRNHILKYISAKLLQQEDHGSTNIRLEWSFPFEAKIYHRWKSIMPELQFCNQQTLTFIKEEGRRKDGYDQRSPVVEIA